MPTARNQDRKRVAVVYPFLYHFREPILRLLCLQDDPEPEYTIFSGLESNVVALELIDPAMAGKPVRDGGLRWRFLDNIWLGRNFLWQRGVLKLSLSREFDTIVFYGFRSFVSTWLAAAFARLTRKRVLIWAHGTYRNVSGPRRWYQVAFFRLGNGVLLFGNWARNIMIRWGFSPAQLYVVFNSLDYDRQRALRQELTAPALETLRNRLFPNSQAPVLVFVGRLVRRKRLDLLLEAARSLARRDKPVNVLIIGEGPETENLRVQAAQLGLTESLCFFGACHDESILAPLLSLADLCVCPAAMGLTAIHAMVYGTPVVTHDRPDLHGPEFEAIVPGVNGQFFHMGDAEDLARAIEEWLQRPVSRTDTAAACHWAVDACYNPHFQARIFNAAVKGTPATALPLRPHDVLPPPIQTEQLT